MKKWLLLIFFVLFGVWIFLHTSSSQKKSTHNPKQPISQGPLQHPETSLFVPYWTLTHSRISGNYASLLYFGISVDSRGIDYADPGFSDIPEFVQDAQGTKKILVVSMTDSELNSQILRNQNVRNSIIADATHIAKVNGFNGVMLDLESSALAFDTVVNRISSFSDDFASTVHKSGMRYDVALFGDTYFRSRPYNVKDIAIHADRVYVMAYDFHKAHGDPGPNFQLGGRNTYGYDLKEMASDFLKDVRQDKISIVFGMFGYDWLMNASSVPVGTSISYNEAKQKFLNSCQLPHCKVTVDSVSKETEVKYSDSEGQHIVWFETPESVSAKIAYLKSIGITSFSYWAYSYF